MEKIDFDKKYVDKLKIHYYSFDEMLAVAIKLEEMGYKLWKPVKNLTELTGNCYYYDGTEWLRTISKFDIRNIGRFRIRNGHRIRIEIEAEDFLKMDIKKFKKIENPDIDPYGEEDWGYEEVKENKKNDFEIGDVVYHRGHPEFGQGVVVHIVHIDRSIVYINFENETGAGSHPNCQYNHGWCTDDDNFYLYSYIGKNKKFKKIENTDIDPYGEEDWGYEEVKENIILKYKNYIKESKSRAIDKFKLVNLNSLIPILGMNEFVKYMNEKVVGKMVQFYNRKDGRNIKKERICNGAYWLEDKRELFIIGNKKEYCVNIFRPFGYYVEYSPSKNLELDPYGEEDWG